MIKMLRNYNTRSHHTRFIPCHAVVSAPSLSLLLMFTEAPKYATASDHPTCSQTTVLGNNDLLPDLSRFRSWCCSILVHASRPLLLTVWRRMNYDHLANGRVFLRVQLLCYYELTCCDTAWFSGFMFCKTCPNLARWLRGKFEEYGLLRTVRLFTSVGPSHIGRKHSRWIGVDISTLRVFGIPGISQRGSFSSLTQHPIPFQPRVQKPQKLKRLWSHKVRLSMG